MIYFTCLVVEHEQVEQIEYRTMESNNYAIESQW